MGDARAPRSRALGIGGLDRACGAIHVDLGDDNELVITDRSSAPIYDHDTSSKASATPSPKLVAQPAVRAVSRDGPTLGAR